MTYAAESKKRIIGIGLTIAIFFILPLTWNGILRIYESIAIIWGIMLIPSVFLLTSLDSKIAKKSRYKFTIALYVLISTFYSLATAVIFNKNLGYSGYFYLLPISLIVMFPSFWLAYRFHFRVSTKTYDIDRDLSERLKNVLGGSFRNLPDVAVVDVGKTFPISHTDGPGALILLNRELLDDLNDEEITAAMIKEFHEIRKNSSLKSLYISNIIFMIPIDVIVAMDISLGIFHSSLFQDIGIVVLLIAVFVIPMSPFFILRVLLRKEMKSDEFAARTLNTVLPVQTYIEKAVNFRPIPVTLSPSRAARLEKNREKRVKKRLVRLNAIKM